MLQITEASAQALKISGTSAAQAQGALLGLSQALAAGTVRAEEYNQILEGGLQPLLQVAANTDKYGGSLARLRQAVIDGKVSSQELFDSILAGSAQLDAQASKATLTLAGALEALTSQLTVYVGQSAQANGATAALAGGIKLLADNIDVIVPALALIAATMGTSMVVSALAGSRAFFALTAALGGAATAAEAATFAFGGLGAVLTGPVGIAAAVVAVGAGLVYLANSSYDAEAAAKDLEQASQNTEATLAAYISRLKEGGASTEELARVDALYFSRLPEQHQVREDGAASRNVAHLDFAFSPSSRWRSVRSRHVSGSLDRRGAGRMSRRGVAHPMLAACPVRLLLLGSATGHPLSR